MAEPAIRGAQLADGIRDVLAPLIARRSPGSFFSIVRVTLSEDLRTARVWVRAYPETGEPDLAGLRARAQKLRSELGKQLARRSAPALRFLPAAPDDSGAFL